VDGALERNPLVGLSIRRCSPRPSARKGLYRLNIERGSVSHSMRMRPEESPNRSGSIPTRWTPKRSRIGGFRRQSLGKPGWGATEESRDLTRFDPSLHSSVDTLKGTKLQSSSALTERVSDVGRRWVENASRPLKNHRRVGRTCRSLIHAGRGRHRVRPLVRLQTAKLGFAIA
jgi:hypothetical protein